jgi:hypothetical protein
MLPILVILLEMSFIAARMLAKLHGRMGHFPSIVNLAENSALVNLQAIRSASVRRRP